MKPLFYYLLNYNYYYCSHKMSVCPSKECPICLETSVENINFIITLCGHKFHSDCLFTNILNNGFDCPLCRNKLMSYDDEDDYSSVESEDINTSEIYITGLRHIFHITVTDNSLVNIQINLSKDIIAWGFFIVAVFVILIYYFNLNLSEKNETII